MKVIFSSSRFAQFACNLYGIGELILTPDSISGIWPISLYTTIHLLICGTDRRPDKKKYFNENTLLSEIFWPAATVSEKC